MEIKAFSQDRGILSCEDSGARIRMIDRGDIIVGGTQIAVALWRSEVNTFQEAFFEKEERWIQLFGLPYHLWSTDNFTMIGNYLGGAVAFDNESVNLVKIGGKD